MNIDVSTLTNKYLGAEFSYNKWSILIVCILLVCLYYFLFKFHQEKTVISGSGSHLVVMVHGFLGAPSEFENLATLFESENYTLYIPGDLSGARSAMYPLKEQANMLTTWMVEDLWGKHFTKLSFIGNSMGGLLVQYIAEELQSRQWMWSENDAPPIPNNVKLENMITLVTPHKGVDPRMEPRSWGLVRYLFDYPRFLFTYLWPVGNDLRQGKILPVYGQGCTFKNYISYVVQGFDLNVPFWSSDFTGGIYHRSTKKIRRYRITESVIGKFLGINTFLDPIVYVGWDMYLVPIGSWVAHGSVVGKHLNAWYTWDPRLTLNSMNHIRERFDPASVITTNQK
jgi:hypothetical protein